jgi:hypothetical protein
MLKKSRLSCALLVEWVQELTKGLLRSQHPFVMVLTKRYKNSN